MNKYIIVNGANKLRNRLILEKKASSNRWVVKYQSLQGGSWSAQQHPGRYSDKSLMRQFGDSDYYKTKTITAEEFEEFVTNNFAEFL